MSVADIMLAPVLDFLAMSKEGSEIISGHVRLLDWLGRMEARPSLKATTMQALQLRYEPV